eukprot:g44963.t1
MACFSCRMWEIRETSSVPGGYACEKFTRLQRLTDHIRELELDALRIIQGAENTIEVVTPRVQAASRWVTTRSSKQAKRIVQDSPVAIPLNN